MSAQQKNILIKKEIGVNYVYWVLLILLIFAGVAFPATVSAQKEQKILIKDHRFDPAEIQIPPAVKVKLVIENQDVSAEEFESYDLNREKVITGKSKAIVFIGPLKPGEYKFFGEFHQDTAQGVIRVVESEKLKE